MSNAYCFGMRDSDVNCAQIATSRPHRMSQSPKAAASLYTSASCDTSASCATDSVSPAVASEPIGRQCASDNSGPNSRSRLKTPPPIEKSEVESGTEGVRSVNTVRPPK